MRLPLLWSSSPLSPLIIWALPKCIGSSSSPVSPAAGASMSLVVALKDRSQTLCIVASRPFLSEIVFLMDLYNKSIYQQFASLPPQDQSSWQNNNYIRYGYIYIQSALKSYRTDYPILLVNTDSVVCVGRSIHTRRHSIQPSSFPPFCTTTSTTSL